MIPMSEEDLSQGTQAPNPLSIVRKIRVCEGEAAAQFLLEWYAMRTRAAPLPRELMDSCLAASQEATMEGFADSVLASAITPFVQKMMDTCYRMGFESGWRIREQQAAFAKGPSHG